MNVTWTLSLRGLQSSGGGRHMNNDHLNIRWGALLKICVGHYKNLESRSPNQPGIQKVEGGFLEFNLKVRFKVLLHYPLSMASNGESFTKEEHLTLSGDIYFKKSFSLMFFTKALIIMGETRTLIVGVALINCFYLEFHRSIKASSKFGAYKSLYPGGEGLGKYKEIV